MKAGLILSASLLAVVLSAPAMATEYRSQNPNDFYGLVQSNAPHQRTDGDYGTYPTPTHLYPHGNHNDYPDIGGQTDN